LVSSTRAGQPCTKVPSPPAVAADVGVSSVESIPPPKLVESTQSADSRWSARIKGAEIGLLDHCASVFISLLKLDFGTDHPFFIIGSPFFPLFPTSFTFYSHFNQ
jgi:hypothetical protein